MLYNIRQMLYFNNLAIKVAWEINDEMIPKSEYNHYFKSFNICPKMHLYNSSTKYEVSI